MDSCIPREEEEEEGFRSKHSCESQLISFAQKVYDDDGPFSKMVNNYSVTVNQVKFLSINPSIK
jgi:hypothetical protein